MKKIETKNKKLILAGRAKKGTYTMSNKMFGSIMGVGLIGETIDSIMGLANEFVYYSNPDHKASGPKMFRAEGMPFRTRISRGLQQSYISSGPEYF